MKGERIVARAPGECTRFNDIDVLRGEQSRNTPLVIGAIVVTNDSITADRWQTPRDVAAIVLE